MRKGRLYGCLSLMLAFITVATTACGGGGAADGGAKGDGKQGETAQQQKSKEPIELHLYSLSGQNIDWFDNTYGKYLYPKFPNITFKVHFPSESSITDYIGSKGQLDIAFGAYTAFHTSMLNLNLQNDISDLIKNDKFDLNRIEPTVVELQRQMANGGIYGIPAFIGTSGLYYNKDLFDKFAVPYPKEGITWDELYDLAVKLTRKDGDTQYYGFANDNLSYLQVNQYSLDLVDPKTFKASFETDAWKKIVQTLTRFMMIPGVDVSQATVANFNTKGIVAMATNYTGCCGFTPGDGVKNWGVIKIPDFPDIRGVGPQTFPNYWYMSSTSKHREAAFEVMKFIISDEFQASLNARGLATALNNPKMYLEYGKDFPKYNGQNVAALFPKHAKMSNITEFQVVAASNLNAALTNIATKGVDINTALREAAEATNKKIEETKGAAKK
ncbi:extracellular solute-binding protein [Paenibacillus ginsengarvi]|uniref:Extracellular solute-binding protein n=1 Tax=Paenibacillus ginsengarvi TaxID=400777 RepID=A0A3B0CH66_9BACL|nr:extracellular solute-binding protein [Paenibacillus ginsengarvi]RKN84291.1 extracellular solute-binding protein [Paenibacillus ginsengarvi]